VGAGIVVLLLSEGLDESSEFLFLSAGGRLDLEPEYLPAGLERTDLDGGFSWA